MKKRGRGNYIRRKNSKKIWTPEEEQYLKEAWGSVSLKSIATHLGRSEGAVIVRVQRLHLPPAMQAGERMSWNYFMKLLHGDNYKGGNYNKQQLIEKGFPVHKQTVRGQNGAKFTTVDIEEFWEFAEKHQYLFDFSKMEKNIFGPEPKWADKKRKRDIEQRQRVKTTPWSQAEDDKLKRILKKGGYTYTEIATELMRTEGAVKRRIITLNIKERPERAVNQPWTPEEEQKLIDLVKQGFSWEVIGEQLNRSALCARGKYERLLNPEYFKRYNRNAREGKEKHERQSTCLHYVKVRGCELDRNTCKHCRHYEPLKEGEKQRSDYVKIHDIAAGGELTNKENFPRLITVRIGIKFKEALF